MFSKTDFTIGFQWFPLVNLLRDNKENHWKPLKISKIPKMFNFFNFQQLSDSGEVGGVNCMEAGHFEAEKKQKLRLVFQLL